MAYGAINVEQMTTQSGFTLGAGNASSFKNRIINGAMVIDQRNAGASVTGGVGYTYPVDRFKFYSSVASKLSGQQSTTATAGFVNSLLLTSLAATAPAAGDEYQLYHAIEGYNTADLGWGTASAKSVTLSFWARSSLTGTFAGCVYNNGGSRCYVFTYTISAANTFEYKTITIPGDTSGTWLTTNSNGITIAWDLGSGSNLNGTADVWASAFDSRTSGSVTLVNTNGATFYITGVQLEVGTVATSFDYRSIGTETALCQRYFAKTYDTATVPGTATAVGAIATNVNATWTYAPSGTWCFPVAMRAQPTVVLYSTQNANTTGVSTADSTDGSATTICLGLSAVSIRRNNNSSGVSQGADIKSQATASAEL